MADCLADSNILLRLCNASDPNYQVAKNALDRLKRDGHRIYIAPQCCYEFWSVATRPQISRGGLGLSPADAEVEISRILTILPLLRDRSDLFDEWRRLVGKYEVSGVNAHDARLVAAMSGHGLTHLLTFNVADFTRYSEIITLNPQRMTDEF